jgi:hypothetical protein
LTERDLFNVIFGNVPGGNLYGELANELYKMYGALIAAGFNENQAIKLIGEIIEKSIK